jgi:hypothetical protein
VSSMGNRPFLQSNLPPIRIAHMNPLLTNEPGFMPIGLITPDAEMQSGSDLDPP